MSKPLKVLVADDETEIRNLIRHWLEAAGHEVLGAGSAREATALLKAGPVDLVVTDILMPDGDGLDLITETRKSQPTARLLAMSGGGRYVETTDCLRMARGFGAHAALLKPFTREQFEAGMAQALGPLPDPAQW
jgi:two-component system chemotaxis response regulator CheY